MTKKSLNPKQAQWSEFLTSFDHRLVYRPGKSNGKPDALTRRPGHLSAQQYERLKIMEQLVVKMRNVPEQLCLLAGSPPARGCPSISVIITEAYETDPLPGKILEAIGTNGSLNDITIAEGMEQMGKFCIEGSVTFRRMINYRYDRYRNIIMEHSTDTRIRAKMFELLNRRYDWKYKAETGESVCTA